MNSSVGMPQSSVGYLRGLLVWYSTKMPSKYVMLHIKGENKKRNMSSKRTLGGDLKVWRLVKL